MPKPYVLVIDDDPDLREALRLMLEPAGYDVALCATGPIGMEAIQRRPPDLIILDIMLASPSEGFHLAYQLKRDEALKHIPVIMISAIGEKMGINYARELGSDYVPADRFLDKPLKAETLLAAVRDTLAGAGNGKKATTK